jgi:hypothetical protein
LLPPVPECCELHALDAALNPESEKHSVEVGLHRAPGHLQLPRDLCVVAALKEQLDDLRLARPKVHDFGRLQHQ